MVKEIEKLLYCKTVIDIQIDPSNIGKLETGLNCKFPKILFAILVNKKTSKILVFSEVDEDLIEKIDEVLSDLKG